MTGINVACIGELLIDMYCIDVDVSLKDGDNFKKMAGGAPANVSATIARLGGKASMIGKVGNDSFGDFLVETLEDYQVDTSMVVRDKSLPTTMALVSLVTGGERDFQFYRGADKNLRMTDFSLTDVMESKVIHFGSATALLEAPLRETYFSLIKRAYNEKKFISFDPNFREDLWKGNENEFIELSREILAYTDFVKVSDEELAILTNEDEVSNGIAKLHQFGAKIVAVTIGEEGSIISNGEKYEVVPSKSIEAIDTTGAGDAFVGAVLYQFSNRLNEEKAISVSDFNYLKEVTRFANYLSSEVCTKVGSLTALASIEEVLILKMP